MGTANTQPTPAPREALAAAIVRRWIAASRLERIKDVAQVHFVVDAQEKVERAEQELAEARATETRSAVADLIGDPRAPGMRVEQAEWALEVVRDDLERARRTREALETEQSKAQADFEWDQRSLDHAVAAVVKSEGGPDRLLVQLDDARREVARLHEILTFLSSKNCVPPVWEVIHPFPLSGADQPWREALKTLEADVGAPLPE